MNSPLVRTQRLADHLDDPGVRIVDASWYLAAMKRDPVAEFEAAHIPGAQFFNIDELSDRANPLPHMMPSAEQFAAGMSALGIGNDDFVVVYDGAGIYSSPRAWWMLRAMGHDKAAVLDGGLPKWRREGRPVERIVARAKPAHFTPHLRPELIRDFDAVRANVESGHEQFLDARSPGRFTAEEPEPRAGIRGGHVPGSRNVYYADLVSADGTMKSAADLRHIFADRGVDLARPAVTSCGSGVTATIVLLALDIAGAKNTALYDGSWSEWGSRHDAPIVTGPA